MKPSPSQVNKAWYLFSSLLRDRAVMPPLKILFSKSPWEAELRRTFRYTRHELTFAKLDGSQGGRFDLVVPLNIDESKLLADNPLLYPENSLPLPKSSLIDLFDDKPAFNKQVEAMGYGAYLPSKNNLKFPFIVKINVGGYGKDCFIIRSDEDRTLHRDKIDSETYFCQELVPGKKEHATHVFIRNGKIEKSLCVEYQFDDTYPIKGQHKPVNICLVKDPHLKVWENLLVEFGYQGICCVNYKMQGTQPLLLEINPRFGGSLALYFFSFLRHLVPGSPTPKRP